MDPGWPPVDLHVPKGLPPGVRPPVVIVLGGVNQPGRAIAKLSGYSALADRRRFLVAYPTARGARPAWDFASTPDDADVDYLRKVIGVLGGPGVCGDPTRVVVTGMSNGGGMTARMACSAADLLAAAAPVSGGYSTLPDCTPARPLSILEIHGASDPIVPYNGKGPAHAGAVQAYVDGWRRRDGCGGAPATKALTPAVTQARWACSTGTIVENDRVAHLGHDWAGEDSQRPFSATVATWQFLSAFRNAGAAR